MHSVRGRKEESTKRKVEVKVQHDPIIHLLNQLSVAPEDPLKMRLASRDYNMEPELMANSHWSCCSFGQTQLKKSRRRLKKVAAG
jgi:hypothetical protein